MEDKPIISCHGDKALLARLQPIIKNGLPRESVEWRRSFGRPARKIKVDCKFVPFQEALIPKEENWTLLGRSFFNVFVTDCDIDGYKASVKDEINSWIAALKGHNVNDWLILVVVHDESKVKSKILRNSIIDKVKNDFCAKHPDRCTVLQEPFRSDSKSAEAWNKLLVLMRTLILQSFTNTLSKFEDHMREQREKRQEGGWSFNHYFLLQEELAFMFEMLGLFEDALVQYDELDALFTQFVLNHAAGDTADWLNTYAETPPQQWNSIILSHPIDVDKRMKIRSNSASLLDFRNYLFLRQSTLLFLLLRPWEVAKRSIPFMHNCLQELDILQLELQSGAAACWVFLTCMEILHTCESFTSTGQMDPYSLHMAVLWDYARKKLCVLGELTQITSTSNEMLPESLDNFLQGTESVNKPDTGPMIKLREALSSQKAFTKHYLELSELAMGAYKHIGRMRAAKLISKDLAHFYMKCGEPQKAEGFLQDALKIYVQENWTAMADETRLALADCQKQLDNLDRYCRTCVHLSASAGLDTDKRRHYQEEVVRIAQTFQDSPICIPTKPLILISEVQPEKPGYTVAEESSLKVVVHLNALEPLSCDEVKVALAFRGEASTNGSTPDTPSSVKQHKRNPSTTSFCSVASGGSIDLLPNPLSQHPHPSNPHPLHPAAPTYPAIHLTQQLEYSANKKRLVAASLKSRVSLRRLETNTKVVLDKEVDKGDYTVQLALEDVMLLPGENTLIVKNTLTEAGQYLATQVCIRVKGLELLRNIPIEEVCFHVVKQDATVELQYNADTLCTGIEHPVTLILHTGSLPITNPTQIQITTDNGLQIKGDNVKNNALEIPATTESCETLKFPLTFICDADFQDTDSAMCQLKVKCEDLAVDCEQHVLFHQPLKIIDKLHTCGVNKFIQIYVESDAQRDFLVQHPSLHCDSNDVEIILINKTTSTMTVNEGQGCSYMWQLKCNLPDPSTCLQCTASVQYRLKTEDFNNTENAEWKTFTKKIKIQDYKTLYKVKTEIERSEDVKIFKEGEEYSLLIRARRLEDTADPNVLYSLLWDSNIYQISGPTMGVLRPDGEGLFSRRLRITPLKGGVHVLPRLHLVKYNSELISDENISSILSSANMKATEPLSSDSIEALLQEHISMQTSLETERLIDGHDRTEASVISGFSVGQVYNVSLSQTVDILNAVDAAQKIIQHPLQELGTVE